MKILVLGGVGYIGFYVCKVIVVWGDILVVFDNLFVGYWDFVCWGLFVEGDICDGDVLDYVFVVY